MFFLQIVFVIALLSMSTIFALVNTASTSQLRSSQMKKLADDRRSDSSYLNSDMNEYNSYTDGGGYGSSYQRSRDNRYGSMSDYGRNFGSSRSNGYNSGGYAGSNRDYQTGSQSQYSTSMMGNNKYGSYSSRYSRNS